MPLASAWPAGGPRKVWQKPVGEGFAGPVVAQGRVIVFHRIANQEIVEALDPRTGDSRWRYAYPTAYRDDFGFDEGPRAVPVVAGDRVYTFGAEGQLTAVDLATGRRIWNVDTTRRFGVRKGFFGAAGSPLVEDGRVIANIGGKDGDKGAGIVAFNAATGARALDSDRATRPAIRRRSPRSSAGGRPRCSSRGMDSSAWIRRPERSGFNGQWRSRLASSVNAATPLVVGDQIFVSATYGTGAALLRVKGSELIDVWSSDEAMSNHYATSVYANGILYGFHDRQEFNPSLRAVDFDTGIVKWTVDRFRAGSVTLAGDKLLIMRETGELVLAAASPQAYRPLAQAQILPPTVRSYPALADGFLYARNNDTHKDVMVCLDLR